MKHGKLAGDYILSCAYAVFWEKSDGIIQTKEIQESANFQFDQPFPFYVYDKHTGYTGPSLKGENYKIENEIKIS